MQLKVWKKLQHKTSRLNRQTRRLCVCDWLSTVFSLDPLTPWLLPVADYRPSDDLLSALATLPADVTYSEESENTRIKQEPLESIELDVKSFALSDLSSESLSPSLHRSDFRHDLLSKEERLRQGSRGNKRDIIKDVDKNGRSRTCS